MATLAGMGIATVVDLRAASELAIDPPTALDHAVTYHHLPVRLRSHPIHGAAVAGLESRVFLAEGRSMQAFLDALDARYGSVAKWGEAVGLTPGTFERIAELLLEPNG